MTALTAYFTGTNDTLLTTARQLSTATPSSQTSVSATGSLPKNGTGWIELASQGGTSTTLSSSEPSVSGDGFILDATILEGQTVAAGSWTPSVTLSVANGSLTVDIHLRVWKRSSAGVYTQFTSSGIVTDLVLSAQTISTTVSTFTFAGTALDSMAFTTGDKLYFDVILNITKGNSYHATQPVTLYENGGTSQSVTTPGYALSPAPVDSGTLSAFASSGMTIGVSITQLASVTLAGGTTLNVAAIIAETSAIALVTSAAINITGASVDYSSTALAGSTILTVITQIVEISSIQLTSLSSLSMTALSIIPADILLISTTSLNTAAIGIAQSNISLNGTTSLNITAIGITPLSISLTSLSSLTTTGVVTTSTSVSLFGNTSLDIVTIGIIPDGVSLVGLSSLTISAVNIGIAAFNANASSTLVATYSITDFGAIPLYATSDIIVPSFDIEVANISLTSISLLNTNSINNIAALAPMNGNTLLSVSSSGSVTGYINISSNSLLSVNTINTVANSISMYSNSLLNTSSLVNESAAVLLMALTMLSGTGGISSSGITGSVALRGDTSIIDTITGTISTVVLIMGVAGMAINSGGHHEPQKLKNFYSPFVPGSANYTIRSTPNGNVMAYSISGTGFAGANNATFVFQTSQYNSKREGYGA